MPDDAPRFVSDENEYGRRAPDYLAGLEHLVATLKTQGQELAFVDRLCAATESFRVALNGQFAFIADAQWTTISRAPLEDGDPLDWPVVGRKVPWAESPSIDEEKRYRIDSAKDGEFSLSMPGLHSVAQTSVTHGTDVFYIAVCNGQDLHSPYLAMDGRVLCALASILILWDQAATEVGQKEATQRLTESLYADARFRGEPSFLSRASEDLAALLAHATGQDKSKERKSKLRPSPTLDEVLADYLDAELTACLTATQKTAEEQGRSTEDTSRSDGLAVATSPSIDAPGSIGRGGYSLTESLGDLAPIESPSTFSTVSVPTKSPDPDVPPLELTVMLAERHITTSVSAASMPRTALAAARLLMWQAYDKLNRAPQSLDDGTLCTPISVRPREDMDDGLVQQSFWSIPQRILDSAPVDAERGLLQIDWLRTYWQRLHYLARNGRSEPKPETLKECAKVYEAIWAMTGRALSGYLAREGQETAIDSDWLLAWLVSNVLASKPLSIRYVGIYQLPKATKIPERYEPGTDSPANCMRYLLYLSECALYALHCARHELRKADFRTDSYADKAQRPPFADVPLALSPTLTEAQIYLVAEYAYYHIGVPRELCVYERLMRQYRSELFLYASGGFYRDHSYHAMDVCLLGELLLRSSVRQEISVSGPAPRLVDRLCRVGSTASSSATLKAWFVAALCHDLGYLYESFAKLIEPLKEVAGDGLDTVVTALQTALNNGTQDAFRVAHDSAQATCPELTSCMKRLAEQDGNLDHGVAAWLHLCSWRKEHHDENGYINVALKAIARHNLADHTLSAAAEPIAALLILCDHVQEWGRARASASAMAYGMMESLRFAHPTTIAGNSHVGQVRIAGCCQRVNFDNDDGPWHAEAPRYRLFRPEDRIDLALPHGEALGSAFEPAISWLNWSRDLQCVTWDSSSSGLSGRITLEHTTPRIWRDLPWAPLEMDLLQDFVASHETAAFLSHWIEAAVSGKNGLCYSAERETGKETFSLCLEELDRAITRPFPKDLIKDFQRWKWRQLSRQFLALNVGWWTMDE